MLFSLNMSFLLRKVEDVTTINQSPSLTLLRINDCTEEEGSSSNRPELAAFFQTLRDKLIEVSVTCDGNIQYQLYVLGWPSG